IVLVTIGSGEERELHWTARVGSESVSLGSLGKGGDHLTFGDWLGIGSPQPAVVSLDSITKEIVWKTVRDNEIASVIFGQDGELVVSGSDLDSNGLGDGLIGRREGRRLRWMVRSDFFVSESGEGESFHFGRRRGVPFFLNYRGDGDWIGVL